MIAKTIHIWPMSNFVGVISGFPPNAKMRLVQESKSRRIVCFMAVFARSTERHLAAIHATGGFFLKLAAQISYCHLALFM